MNKGDYVFATKYSDGDPWDGWAVGYYDGTLAEYGKPERHIVIDDNENQFRRNGFRRCEKVTADEGNFIIAFNQSIVTNGHYPEKPIYNLWEELERYRLSKNEKAPQED